jgi:6-phosphogluconate dehydrogenase
MAAGQAIGIVGLGRIGAGLALNALGKGIRVVGQTRSGAKPELLQAGLEEIRDPREFRAKLPRPRRVLLYLPAGPVTGTGIEALAEALEPGDVIADGGNAYWGDSIGRQARLAGRGLHFVDLGTSGGVDGAREGACFMAGGEPAAVALLEPVLRAVAVEGGFVHAGPPGAGHFVKLVHNGIEFGMLQAIAEGYGLLRRFRAPLDIPGTVECWRHGSVIRSWLVDLLAEALRRDPKLERPSGFIEDTGEVNWLVMDAMRMEAPIPVIAQSVMQLFASRGAAEAAAKAVVQMRNGFGGHPFGPEEGVARERREGRVGDVFRPAQDDGEASRR